ncbi:MAG TPA: hypothetical protein ENN75_00075 [candidate division Zixibacteria bacterium]|nr:hypothetical protein [candidate division Zixibacteria bacterium]
MYLIIESIRSAVDSLRSHPLRTILTMLGILVGVTTIILIVSLIAGLDGMVAKEFSRVGTRVLYVSRAQWSGLFLACPRNWSEGARGGKTGVSDRIRCAIQTVPWGINAQRRRTSEYADCRHNRRFSPCSRDSNRDGTFFFAFRSRKGNTNHRHRLGYLRTAFPRRRGST